jgi:hypothetical protein
MGATEDKIMTAQESTMESRFCREPMKEKLKHDFSYVMEWAKTHDRPEIEIAARTMFGVVASGDPARALRSGGAQTRDALLVIANIGKELAQKPKDDADRNDPRLRTGSRRAKELMNSAGYHFQHT